MKCNYTEDVVNVLSQPFHKWETELSDTNIYWKNLPTF